MTVFLYTREGEGGREGGGGEGGRVLDAIMFILKSRDKMFKILREKVIRT